MYQAPGRRLYATPEHVHSERALVAATRRHHAPSLTGETVARFLSGLAGAGVASGADQAAAVRGVLTSGAAVESLVGPAGTGKSFVIGALAKAWQDPALWDGHQRRVVGLASSQIATDLLAGEGVHARNVARWLATQRRLAEGRGAGDDEQWRLRAGDLVVDEPSMANTADLAAIHHHVSAAGAKLLLTGDHRQLAAVGAGGRHGSGGRGRHGLRTGRGPPLLPRVGGRRVAAAARRRRDRAGRVPQARPPDRRRHPRAGRDRRHPRLAGRHPGRPAVAADRGHQRTSRPRVG